MGDMWSVLPGRSVALDLELDTRSGPIHLPGVESCKGLLYDYLSHQSLASKHFRLRVIREGILLDTQFVSIDSI